MSDDRQAIIVQGALDALIAEVSPKLVALEEVGCYLGAALRTGAWNAGALALGHNLPAFENPNLFTPERARRTIEVLGFHHLLLALEESELGPMVLRLASAPADDLLFVAAALYAEVIPDRVVTADAKSVFRDLAGLRGLTGNKGIAYSFRLYETVYQAVLGEESAPDLAGPIVILEVAHNVHRQMFKKELTQAQRNLRPASRGFLGRRRTR